jgi:hypothetical protein
MRGRAVDAGRAPHAPCHAREIYILTNSPVLGKWRHDSSTHNREQIELAVGVDAEVLAHLNDVPGTARRKPNGLLLLHQHLAIDDKRIFGSTASGPPGSPMVVSTAALMRPVLLHLLGEAEGAAPTSLSAWRAAQHRDKTRRASRAGHPTHNARQLDAAATALGPVRRHLPDLLA